MVSLKSLLLNLFRYLTVTTFADSWSHAAKTEENVNCTVETMKGN